ncbi:MAG TPA: peptidylprolyl isomerase [Gemmatimonadales bacterium]|jgi:peptidyl-prolyl cis-trans isomerase A (cyclophilin A)|nr:peptidylprolyl isomerase [Gemmatimonadales bacterium]
MRTLLAVAFLALLAPPAHAQTPLGAITVRIETTAGSILVTLDSARAPITTVNFLEYVDGGYYTNGSFFRTVRADNQPRDSVKIGVIQGGPDTTKNGDAFGPIPLERTTATGLHHLDGTISMARDGPNTATSSFFICIGDQPSLDFGGHRNLDGQGFAAFGRVIQGMDVVRRIQADPADGQRLTPPVTILSIERVAR